MKKNSTKFRSGERLREFQKRNRNEEAVQLATYLVMNSREAYRKIMHFVDAQAPSDAYQACYYFETIIRLIALDEASVQRFAHINHASKGYVRMCELARAVRSILNTEEE